MTQLQVPAEWCRTCALCCMARIFLAGFFWYPELLHNVCRLFPGFWIGNSWKGNWIFRFRGIIVCFLLFLGFSGFSFVLWVLSFFASFSFCSLVNISYSVWLGHRPRTALNWHLDFLQFFAWLFDFFICDFKLPVVLSLKFRDLVVSSLVIVFLSLFYWFVFFEMFI